MFLPNGFVKKMMDAEKSKICLSHIGELVTMNIPGHEGPLLPSEIKDVQILENAYVQIEGQRISSYGFMDMCDLSEADEVIDIQGKTVLPGFVDPHTHLIFAGSREHELLARIQQTRYPNKNEKMSGGINTTVAHTREAEREELIDEALKRLRRLLQHGVTTVEAKSGYGLDLENELKSLAVIQELKSLQPIELVATFLGAHAIPTGKERSTYVQEVLEMLPIVAEKKLAEFCDVFCENGFFTPEDTRLILETARKYQLKLKVHADELGDTGGAFLAGELQAISADHLQFASLEGLKKMKANNTMAVLLPGTAFYLDLPFCDTEKMRQIDLPMALSTDLNPGGSYCESMPLMLTLACTKMNMTPLEALVGATLNAAYAIDRGKLMGSIRPGKQADLIVLDAPNHHYIPYHFGVNLVDMVIKKGQDVTVI